MTPEREQELIAHTLMGEEARKFWESDIGRYIKGCIDQEIKAAQIDFKTTYASDTRKIEEIQNRIWRAESLEGWINDLITAGDQALKIYQQEKEEH